METSHAGLTPKSESHDSHQMARENTVYPRKRRAASRGGINGRIEFSLEPKGRPVEGFENIPGDLGANILSRLSIRALSNCMLVCKYWLSIIRDPQFALENSPMGILSYTNPKNSAGRRLVFTLIEERRGGGASRSPLFVDRLTFASPDNDQSFFEFDLRNSCNGLVCFSRSSTENCFVVNPVLGEYIAIPAPEKWMIDGNAFFALGFSSGTNEYKVLHLNPRLTNAMIYTIGTRVWRSINGNACYRSPSLPFNSFLHSALHWMGSDQVIQSFDFEREQFRSLAAPPIERGKIKLGVFQGCLFLCDFGKNWWFSENGTMWIMKDYGVKESWTKVLVFENLCPNDDSKFLYEPFMFLSDGQILMSSADAKSLVRYNPEKKSLKNTRYILTTSVFSATSYTFRCFRSIRHVFKGEMVKSYRRQQVNKLKANEKLTFLNAVKSEFP